MTDRDLPVTEDELHAYVDGELPSDRRPTIEAWLAAHPDDMARVNAWRMGWPRSSWRRPDWSPLKLKPWLPY